MSVFHQPMCMFFNYLADFFERLYDSDLVVDAHYRDQGRLWANSSRQLSHVVEPVLLNRQIGHLVQCTQQTRIRLYKANSSLWSRPPPT